MHPNISKCTKMSVLGPMGVDWVRSLRKILTRLRGTNFWTISARFASGFVEQSNGPVCTQIVRTAPKRQFRVRWGGSGAFVAKNYDTTSWHELLHSFGPFCTEFRKATKRYRMHTNSIKCTLGTNGVHRCVHCEKIRRDFVARTFALVRPVLHGVR